MRGRRIFQWFTLFLFVLSAWTAYANVLSDDTAVRAQARAVAFEAAGCAEDCKVEGLRGDRGMLDETITFEVLRRGHFLIICRRPYVAFGDHRCVVADRSTPATPPTPMPSPPPRPMPSSPPRPTPTPPPRPTPSSPPTPMP